MHALDYLRSHDLALPNLAKFALALAIIVGVPPLSRWARLPAVVGLLLSGVILGPHVFNVFGTNAPIAGFLGELGKLLLMFFAGLEIDLAQFRQAQRKTMTFGLLTTLLPLLLGIAVEFLLGLEPLTAVVLGSLLASHTLLGLSIIRGLGAGSLKPITVTVGATVVSDTLSLIVFAVCLSTFQSGFSVAGLALQIIEIVIFVPLILFGLSRAGAFVLRKIEAYEDAYFIVMLAIIAIAGASGAAYQPAGDCRRLPRRPGGQRSGARQAREGKAGVHRKHLLHPDLLHRHGVPDRSAHLHRQHL